MNRPPTEWLWRLAVLAALLWIGWELHQLREDLAEPVDDGEEQAQAV